MSHSLLRRLRSLERRRHQARRMTIYEIWPDMPADERRRRALAFIEHDRQGFRPMLVSERGDVELDLWLTAGVVA